MHFNRRKFSGASKQFYSTSYFQVGFKNAKINYFEEKMGLECSLIKLKFGWLQTCLTDMEKHKTLEMLLRRVF